MLFDFWSAYWAFVAFVFGAIVGSFLNVCIWRLPRGLNLSDPPSNCPHCEHRLKFLPDMVPMFSQLWYRSHCRYCGAKFSWRYFWVELFTALMFTAIYLRFVTFGNPMFNETQQTVISGCCMLFAAALITLFFIDLDTFNIHDSTVYLAVAAALIKDIYLIATGARALGQHLPGIPFAIPIPLSVLGGLLAFWLMWQFAALASAAMGREAMGAGDSLLLGAMGAFLVPWPLVVVAFLLSVALGSVGGIMGRLMAKPQADASPEEETADSGQPTEIAADAQVELNGAAILNGHFDERLETAEESGQREPVAAYAHAHAAEAEGAILTRSAEVLDEDPAAPLESESSPASEEQAPVENVAPPYPVDDDGAPLMPAGSRWGRLWTVMGTWIGLGALYGALAQFQENPTGALMVGVIGLAAAAGLLFFGIRLWVASDQPFLEQMDAFFEDDEPGPRFIPFGPYLVLGSFAAMLFGRQLVEMYCTFNGIDLAGIQTLPWEVPGRTP